MADETIKDCIDGFTEGLPEGFDDGLKEGNLDDSTSVGFTVGICDGLLLDALADEIKDTFTKPSLEQTPLLYTTGWFFDNIDGRQKDEPPAPPPFNPLPPP